MTTLVITEQIKTDFGTASPLKTKSDDADALQARRGLAGGGSGERPMLGRAHRVYEVLNRKRPLTLKIWPLHTDIRN